MPESTAPCFACGSEETRLIVEAPSLPAHVCSYWPKVEDALACPRGDMELRFCEACGFLQNSRFDEKTAEYSGTYENSLHCSEFFQGYIGELIEQILERHDTSGGVLEIGCGNGEFLTQICERGSCSGVGFDPSYDPELPDTGLGGRVRFVRDYYSEEYRDVSASLVVCRQVVEHIPNPGTFLDRIHRALAGKENPAVIVEVPNILYTLKQKSLWDIVYEHPNYFNEMTLANLFARHGFSVTDVWETYSDQFVAVDATPVGAGEGRVLPGGLIEMPELRRLVDDFGAAYVERIAAWKSRLADLTASGRRVVLWGAGARGVTFLNLVDPDRHIDFVVDINHRKHGLHVVGTGQRVFAPAHLREAQPDLVIIVNPIYRDEIQRDLASMGLHPEIQQA